MNSKSHWYLNHIVKPTLTDLNRPFPALEKVLAAIAQCPSKVAVGFGDYNLSHEQHWDLWDNYLVLTPELASTVRGMAGQHRFLNNPDAELELNAGYATAIAAMHLEFVSGSAISANTDEKQLLSIWQSNGGGQKVTDIDQVIEQLKKPLAA